MYQYCAGCDGKHRGITSEERLKILEAYQDGTAQVVTADYGILDRCILDILDISSFYVKMKSEKGRVLVGLGL